MAYLLDTCVISEPRQKAPEPKVLQFLAELRPSESFLSVFSLGEIWKGIELRPPSRQRAVLTAWFQGDLVPSFAGRILVLDQDCLIAWGGLTARLQLAGTPMPVIDSLIAATALVHGVTVVTRNAADFAASGVAVFNPWK
jgi:toxin FitB